MAYAVDPRLVFIALKQHYSNADNAQKIITECALLAAGADVAATWIPGLAIPATITACFASVWLMYARLCKELKISLSENMLKLIAKAVLANIGANLGGLMIGAVVGMFIPVASVAVGASLTFIVVYLAGLIFLQLIVNMAEKSTDKKSFSDITEDQFKEGAASITFDKNTVNAAKTAYKNNK